MAKNSVNFFKVFILVNTVLTTVVKLVKEFVENNQLDNSDDQEVLGD